MPAPIVLFVYNRPAHTRSTLQSLAKNPEARNSALFIYADGPRTGSSAEQLAAIEETRKIIREEQWCGSVKIIESQINKGLANSVIDGVTEIVNEYGKVIVLEDDLVLSKNFLSYMNEALNRYKDDQRVFQVSGYMFPVPEIEDSHQAFFLSLTTSWGWATWKRAWDHFDPLCAGYEVLKTDKALRKKFDFNSSYPYYDMLLNQMEIKKIDSWAIKWWWAVFRKNGLTLYPTRSLVHNIGWDGSGRHSPNGNPFENILASNNYSMSEYPDKVVADAKKDELLQFYLRKTINHGGKEKPGYHFRSFVDSIAKYIRF